MGIHQSDEAFLSGASISTLINLLKEAIGPGRYVETMRGWEATRALARIGLAAVPALIPVLRDERPACDMAAAALGTIGPEAKEAIPELLEQIEKHTAERVDRSPLGLTEALETLKKIDPKAAAAAQAQVMELARGIARDELQDMLFNTAL